jgi:hypothetical protein
MQQTIHFADVFGAPADTLEETQVGASGEVGIEGGRFNQCADALQCVEVSAAHILAEELDGTGSGRYQAEDEADDGGFARAVGAEQAEDAALGDANSEVIDGEDGAELLSQCVDLDQVDG